MPAPFGVTTTGFSRKTVRDIIAEMEADELALIADDLDLDPDQLVGQLNGIFARQLGIGWEQLEFCHNGFDPDAAEGRLLEMLSKLTGTFRQGDTFSTVTLICNLDNGTELVTEETFAATDDHPDVRWTPVEDYTATADGPVSILFRCEQLGPIQGFAGTINIIATPTTGWNTVVNPDDAELGLRTDDDNALRARRVKEIATIGSATVRAITANVVQAFGAKIQTLVVFENDGDNVDSRGMLPHSLEVLIFDGDIPAVDNDELAQVIFDSKAGGIHTSGNTSGTAVALVNGLDADKEVLFSRAEQLDMYLEIDLVKKAGVPYLGDAAVKQYVATAANAYFGPGDYIIGERIHAFAMVCAGVKDITAVRVGFTALPIATDNIPISIRQIGRFSTSRIVVNAA